VKLFVERIAEIGKKRQLFVEWIGVGQNQLLACLQLLPLLAQQESD